MLHPPLFEQRDTNENVLGYRLLHKAIYGLKKVVRTWFTKLKKFLTHKFFFVISQSNGCLFVKSTSIGVVILLIYVNNVVIQWCDSDEVEHVIGSINVEIILKNLGSLN